MIAFLDSSVVARRYLAEPGSAQVRALLRSTRSIAVSRLAIAEVAAAVARASRLGAITPKQRDEVFARLGDDFGDFTIVELKRSVIDRVPALVLAHPLRSGDAIQLASCLALRGAGPAVELWSNDGELSRAARAEGLKTVAL